MRDRGRPVPLRTHLPRALAPAAACLLAFGSAGCIPVNMIEPASPALVGVYRRSDGTPAAGARVAVTTGHRDATCVRALERTAVDSAGVFRLRATTLRRRWLLLIPPIERFFNHYWLCAGASDTVLGMAYHGRTSLGYRDGTAPDTVRCLEWPWQIEEARLEVAPEVAAPGSSHLLLPT